MPRRVAEYEALHDRAAVTELVLWLCAVLAVILVLVLLREMLDL